MRIYAKCHPEPIWNDQGGALGFFEEATPQLEEAQEKEQDQ